MAVFTIDNIKTKISKFKDKLVFIPELLEFCSENNCSDLYIKVGDYPYINRYGRILRVPCLPINTKIWNEFANIAISSERNAEYVRGKMLDFAFTIPIPEDSEYYNRFDEFRYRVSSGYSGNKNIATFRMITPELPSFSKLNFPDQIVEKLELSFRKRSGIIILAGPTGSGKTTTLAASINDFTKKGKPLDNSMIITLEDPCEYIYESTNSVKINQKELGVDFKSFGLGVKQSLREHPNMILCGEIRDKEVISTTIEAARTGHLVSTTLHSDSVAGTVSRLAYYLQDSGTDMMYDLIINLNFILAQRISAIGTRFLLDTQYMFFTDSITKHLLDMVDQNKNITRTINALFTDENLVKSGVVKDWDKTSKEI